MSSNDTGLWTLLEKRMGRLFVVAGVLSLVAAANYGVAELLDGVAFNEWVGLTVLLARVASLLAVAGLSVRLVDRNRTVGLVSRGVVTLALLSTVVLLTTAVLSNLGVEPPLEAVFGFGTLALSLVTYSLFGGAVLRTDAHPRSVGALLLAATVALLFGLFGRALLPVGVVGTVAELGLFATHVGIGRRLGTEPAPDDRTDPSPSTAAE